MNKKKDIYEPDQIKSVFTFLKTEKNITGLSETSGVTTITTDSLVLLADTVPIYLTTGQIVTVSSVNYAVSNVNYTLKTFDITATGITASKWNLAINFKFGSRIEINELLLIEAKEQSLQRFPLVWLFINESRAHDNLDYDYTTSLKMSFVNLSDSKSRAQARLDDNFKKVLQPLETLFLRTIQSAYFATVFNWEFTELTYTDYYRYFYGSSDKNEMVLTAPTDAIELELDITFQNQY